MSNRPFLERVYWVAGVVVAIVSLIGLISSRTHESPSQHISIGSGTGTTVVGSSSAPITINQGTLPSDTKEDLAIIGRWNDDTAIVIAQEALRNAESKMKVDLCFQSSTCQLAHKLIGKYSLVYAQKEVTLILYASSENGLACHACAPYISIFEFERRALGWKHVQSDAAAFQWGSWGSLDSAHVMVQPIGSSVFGVIFDLGYTQGGYAEYAIAIWAKLADDYRKILHIPSGISDSGTLNPGQEDWKAKLNFQSSSSVSLYPISVHVSGVIDGISVSTDTSFVFNGIEYKGQQSPEYLLAIDCIQKDPFGRCS